MEEVAERLDARMGEAEERLDGAIAYRALVRYDAYGELSGHQSATLALLDAERNGVVLSSIAHRDTARLYASRSSTGAASTCSRRRRTRRSACALAGERGSAVLERLMRAGYLGPPGTNSHEALVAAGRGRRAGRRSPTRPRGRRAPCRPARSSAALAPPENSLRGRRGRDARRARVRRAATS